MHVGGIERGRCGSRAVAVLSEGTLARDVTKEYSRGTPSYGCSARGPSGAHRCCGYGVVPPERPSPLRVCSKLRQNALNGSVPSSLSALINLELLCVPPSCQRRLRVRPRRVGSVGSAPSARHVGGCLSGESSGGGAAAGLLRYSQSGPRACDVIKEYSRGTPSYGYGARVP
jgi:hypothetical protein